MAQVDTTAYPLGYSVHERTRLEQQAAFLGELTADLLRRAGLRPGMKVLDVGCGMGDVSLLAAQIVGPEGSVVGVDRDAAGLARAKERAAAAAITNVGFVQAELPVLDFEGAFDALIGRLVLLYFPDPAIALGQLLEAVRPGGIVAFHEADLSRAGAIPPIPAMTDNVARLNAVFARCGFHPAMGIELDRTMRTVGLTPSLLGVTRMEGQGEGFSPAWITETLRSLMPAIVKTGVATEQEMAIDTLEERIRAEAREAGALILGPLMVGAWAVRP